MSGPAWGGPGRSGGESAIGQRGPEAKEQSRSGGAAERPGDAPVALRGSCAAEVSCRRERGRGDKTRLE